MRIVCIVRYGLSQVGISEAPGVFREANPDTGHHATQADTHVGR